MGDEKLREVSVSYSFVLTITMLINNARKKMIPIPLLVFFYLVQAFGTAKSFINLLTK